MVRTVLRTAAWVAGLALGVVAESTRHPPLHALDAVTGFVVLFAAVADSRFARDPPGGWLMFGVSATWFLGTLDPAGVFWHRAPLAQLIVTHPARKLWPGRGVERVATAAAYGYALIPSVARSAGATIAFAAGLTGVALFRAATAGGSDQRSRAFALAAAAGFAAVLIVPAGYRLNNRPVPEAALAAYEIVVMTCCVSLAGDLLWSRLAQHAITSVVVDLGGPSGGTLGDHLRRALRDRELTIGYWIEELGGYVNDSGQPVQLRAGGGRTVHRIDDDGQRLAVIVTNVRVIDDPELFGAVGGAIRLALRNARLNAEVRTRAIEIDASRRRLLTAVDEQRKDIARELSDGPMRQLASVDHLLAAAGSNAEPLRRRLSDARAELEDLGRGIHPPVLAERGLALALDELAARSATHVIASTTGTRFPAAVELAAYFICSEALANADKHAQATEVRLVVQRSAAGAVTIDITDDGIGGADSRAGSGLRGLQDRAEALGGRMTIVSPSGRGTQIHVELPVRPAAPLAWPSSGALAPE
jgi:signal transduction histidine kinase